MRSRACLLALGGIVPMAAAGIAHKPLTPPPPPLQALLLRWFVVVDHDILFVLSESVHFIGIGLLAYKLIKKRGAGGVQSTGRRRCHLPPASAASRCCPTPLPLLSLPSSGPPLLSLPCRPVPADAGADGSLPAGAPVLLLHDGV